MATDVGYVNFAIEDNINGILVKEGDVKGFVNAILTLSNDPNKRKSLGNNGRIKAVNSLTWYENVNNFLKPLMNNI